VTVVLPLWLALLLLVLSLWFLLERLLMPGVRWFLRQRANRVIEQLNTRLPIQLPPFKLTKRQALVDRVTYHPRVLRAVETEVEATGTPREVVMRRVERHADEIVPAFNAYLYFRIGYGLARRLARMLYRVRLGWSDEEGLTSIPRDATVVFVMNHRSNMDYILVGYLAARRAALSYAVGEWARVWPLQALVRSMGAYFIRRRSGDPLYRRVLECYVHLATAAGVTQAVYPEGGLSRDGALREPKLGLLDYMLRSFDPGGPRDVVFVPVGINYDRTLEDRTLLLDLEPGSERRGAVRAMATALRFLGRNLGLMARSRWHRFGYACVAFGTPVSARAYMRARGLDFREMEKEARAPHVAAIGRELMDAVGAVIPVLPVSLVSTVFLQAEEETLSELEVKSRVQLLMRGLSERGAHVYVPRRDADYAIHFGLRTLTLRRLVLESDGLFRADPAERRLLAYYANSIAHLLEPGSHAAAAGAAVSAGPAAPIRSPGVRTPSPPGG
jgi:glycerol-3-phosphate O-acyltransferase